MRARGEGILSAHPEYFTESRVSSLALATHRIQENGNKSLRTAAGLKDSGRWLSLAKQEQWDSKEKKYMVWERVGGPWEQWILAPQCDRRGWAQAARCGSELLHQRRVANDADPSVKRQETSR